MSQVNQQEYERLIAQIKEWNANRLDLFEISYPDEKLDFYGVIRFFFQGDDGKYQSKCLRVSNRHTTAYLVSLLIQKFHPDLRMLTVDQYKLYECHALEETDRCLAETEIPLLVQLNWAMDDREGKFVLKNESRRQGAIESARSISGTSSRVNSRPTTPSSIVVDPRYSSSETDLRMSASLNSLGPSKDASLASTTVGNSDGAVASFGFKRRWSSSKRKRVQKQMEAQQLAAAEARRRAEELLTSRPPETSFTRTLSNSEIVMRRRRQQKMEARARPISQDVTALPLTAGAEPSRPAESSIRIFGEVLNPNVSYKMVKLNVVDQASTVITRTMQMYGVDTNLSKRYCLLQLQLENVDNSRSSTLSVFRLRDTDCPLGILYYDPPTRGNYIFQISPLNETIPFRSKPVPPQADEFYHNNTTGPMLRSQTLTRSARSTTGANRLAVSAEFKTKSSTPQVFFPTEPPQENNVVKKTTLSNQLRSSARQPPIQTPETIFFPGAQFEALAPYLMEVHSDGRRKETGRVFRMSTLLSAQTMRAHSILVPQGQRAFAPVKIGSSSMRVGPCPPGILLTTNSLQTPQRQEVPPEIWPLHCTVERRLGEQGRIEIVPSVSESQQNPTLKASAPIRVNRTPIYEPTALLNGSIVQLGESGAFCYRFVDPTNETASVGPSVSLTTSNTNNNNNNSTFTKVQSSSRGVGGGGGSGGGVTSSTRVQELRENQRRTNRTQTNRHHTVSSVTFTHTTSQPASAYPPANNSTNNSNHINSATATPNSTAPLKPMNGSQRMSALPSTKSPKPLPQPAPPLPPQMSSLPSASSESSESTRSPQNVLALDFLPIQVDFSLSQEATVVQMIVNYGQNTVSEDIDKFYLVPAYALYCGVRGVCVLDHSRLNRFMLTVTDSVKQVIESNREDIPALIFWLSNSLEFLHFMKRDEQLANSDLQEMHSHHVTLGNSIDVAFHLLLNYLRHQVDLFGAAFFGPRWVAEDESLVAWLNERDSENGPPQPDPTEPSSGGSLTKLLTSFHEVMRLLRTRGVNVALTIQLFSQVFHHVNQWLFNQLIDSVDEPSGENSNSDNESLLTEQVCEKVRYRLACLKEWAQQQGLELAAGCHLQTIEQACCLVLLPKRNADIKDLYDSVTSLTFLNSVQVRYILDHSQSTLPNKWVELLVEGVREVTDRMLLDELGVGGRLQLHEPERLSLPLLLPDEGYSVDQNSPQEELRATEEVWSLFSQLLQVGLLGRLSRNSRPEATWDPRIGWRLLQQWEKEKPTPAVNKDTSDLGIIRTRGGLPSPPTTTDSTPRTPGTSKNGGDHTKPAIVSQSVNKVNTSGQVTIRAAHQNTVTSPQPNVSIPTKANISHYQLRKINRSLGLGIVVAVVPGDPGNGNGIYIHDIPSGGAAALDGRLSCGDQILALDKTSLVGAEHSQAVQLMKNSGDVVTLTVDKGAAYRKGIAHLVLKEQTATTPRAGPSPRYPIGYIPSQSIKIPVVPPLQSQSQLVWTETDLDFSRMRKYRVVPEERPPQRRDLTDQKFVNHGQHNYGDDSSSSQGSSTDTETDMTGDNKGDKVMKRATTPDRRPQTNMPIRRDPSQEAIYAVVNKSSSNKDRTGTQSSTRNTVDSWNKEAETQRQSSQAPTGPPIGKRAPRPRPAFQQLPGQ